ncbi:hypothetical protein G9A89_010826 [Geosiphon pyriformis]|nr:hypothetical protein G9A89_010826 [Geosiphon pyriformis]
MTPGASTFSEPIVTEENVISKKNILKPPVKPNEEAYLKSLGEIKDTIDKLQEEMALLTEKINNVEISGPAALKRDELRARLDIIRGKQAEIKQSRSKIWEQLKTMNESLQKKKRDLRFSKDKLQFKTTKEIDAQISKLDRQIESGSLKIIDERRIIAEISTLNKSKKTVEAFELHQDAIENDQKAIDDIKSTLDDGDLKKYNLEYDEIKAQLDEINQGQAEHRAKRDELFGEKKRLRDLINTEITKRRTLQEEFTKAKNDHRQWQDEERRRKWEMQKEKQEQYVAQQRADVAAQIREEAAIPAFQDEIVTCETLLHYFQSLQGNGKITEQIPNPSSANLNLREPDISSNIPKGMMLTKKSDRKEDYFVGGKYSSKKNKSAKDKKPGKTNGFHHDILRQLTSVKVAIPTNLSEVEKTIVELTEKRAYYIENQSKITKENVEKAEAHIAALETRTHDRRTTEHRPRNRHFKNAEAEEFIPDSPNVSKNEVGHVETMDLDTDQSNNTANIINTTTILSTNIEIQEIE